MTVTKQPLSVTTTPLGGSHLIEASAGTGKTYTITSLVLRYLTEWELPISQVLAVTFTNAATAELKERIGERINQALRVVLGHADAGGDPVFTKLLTLKDRSKVTELLRRAASDVDRAGVFTIHGFAARVLQEHPFETGAREDAELIGDERALVVDVVTDFWTSRIATEPPEVFLYLGGSKFFSALLTIGQRAAGADRVPLVQVNDKPDLEALSARFLSSFERARSLFLTHGAEVLQLLCGFSGFSQTKMKGGDLRKEYKSLSAYFRTTRPYEAYPNKERFTQSKVSSSLNKGAGPAPQHELLVILDELKEDYAQLEAGALALQDYYRHELCEILRDRAELEHVRAGTQSFDGLLRDLLTALCSERRGHALALRLRQSYPVALIDEFQDTDPVQFEIFDRIYQPEAMEPRTSLHLIGDPKQSIYAFRGADVNTYLEAGARVASSVWTLSTSYRASPRLIQAQNTLFSLPKEAFSVEGIGYEQVEPRPGARDELRSSQGESLPGIDVVVHRPEKNSDWLRVTAAEVARFLQAGHLLGGRAVVPRDLAVLTRTNRQAQMIQRLLWDLSIPAVMHGDRSVLEAPEAFELRRILLALAEPGSRTLLRTALGTRLLGLSASDLASLDDSPEVLEMWATRMSRYGDLWRDRGVAHALEALGTEVSSASRTLKERDGERRMTNFRHLLEILHEVQTTEHLGVAGLLRWFEGALADPFGHAMASEARQLRLESDADAVTLTTAHKSKGLEYEIVFLSHIGFPESNHFDEAFRFRDDGKTLFEMRTKETRGSSEERRRLAQNQESLRLAYVALTRAKHHVVVLSGEDNKFSALSYFFHERGAGAPHGLEAFLVRSKKLSPQVRSAEMSEAVARSEGALRIRQYQRGETPAYLVDRQRPVLEPPPPVRKLIEQEKTSSFSAMTRDAPGASLSRAAREGRDVDEVDAAVDADLLDAASVLGGHAPSSLVESRSLLADFPRGAKPGDALHWALEQMPMGEGNEAARALAVRAALLPRGFSEEHVLAAEKALAQVFETPLGLEQGAPRLIGLGARERKAEMEFSLPVGKTGVRLSSKRLAESLGLSDSRALSTPGDGDFLSAGYLRSVERLSFGAWAGFLRGFIDLVYVHKNKLYGLDYKSNHLGDDYEDYSQTAMRHAMEHHHYLLQALLYAVAIHRYGRARLAGYTYQTHFGGMQYLFLRGMHPKRRTGVFSFRPSEGLIESLSAALEGEG